MHFQSSSERVWIERPERNGGGAESEAWNGSSTSPRKEFGTARPAAGDNTWRSREAMRERAERAENKEEEDGWRTAGRGERWGMMSLQENSHANLNTFLKIYFSFNSQVELAGVLNVKVGNVTHRVVRNEIRGLKVVIIVAEEELVAAAVELENVRKGSIALGTMMAVQRVVLVSTLTAVGVVEAGIIPIGGVGMKTTLFPSGKQPS